MAQDPTQQEYLGPEERFWNLHRYLYRYIDIYRYIYIKYFVMRYFSVKR